MNNMIIVNKDILKLKQNGEGGHKLSVGLKRPVGPKVKQAGGPTFLIKTSEFAELGGHSAASWNLILQMRKLRFGEALSQAQIKEDRAGINVRDQTNPSPCLMQPLPIPEHSPLLVSPKGTFWGNFPCACSGPGPW